MEWQVALLVFFISLIGLMVAGLPMAFCFLLLNLFGVFFLFGGEVGLWQLNLSIFTTLTTFVFLPLPLFILMGEVLYHSGVAPLMMDAMDKLIGRLPGRLGLLAIGSGSLFSTLTGTSSATVAMLGSTLVPQMEERGYKKPMSLGPILGSGGLAVMIPPSGLAVLIGAVALISVGKILMAIIMPGVLMAFLYASYTILRCWLQPSIAPSYQVTGFSISQKLVAIVRYVLPIGVVIFLVIGVIFLGIASPTEAAATGTVGTFILAAAYRRLNWEVVKKSISAALEIAVFLLILVAGASAFSQVLAMSGATQGLINVVAQAGLPPIVVLIAMQIILLFLGMFIDAGPIVMMIIPVYMPIVSALGFNPVWFATIFLLNLEMSVTTPPFGIALFVMKGVAPPDTTMGDIYKAGLPFLGCDAIAMALIMAFPAIALWLPAMMR